MCLRNVTVYKNLIRSTVITACEIWVLTKDMTDRRYGKNKTEFGKKGVTIGVV